VIGVTMTPAQGRSAILNAQLDRFARTIQERQKIARKQGGSVRTLSRKNIRRQQTVAGAPFERRKNARDTRRMLLGLDREMAVISRASSGGGVVVSWKNRLVAGIAGRHQLGLGEAWDPPLAAKVYGVPKYGNPCTRRQAKALIREGYRLMVPAPGGGRGPGRNKRPRRVTVMWLEQNFSLGQAGLILRLMRTGKARGAQAWKDTVPVRDFLGVTDAQANDMAAKLAQTLARAATK